MENMLYAQLALRPKPMPGSLPMGGESQNQENEGGHQKMLFIGIDDEIGDIKSDLEDPNVKAI